MPHYIIITSSSLVSGSFQSTNTINRTKQIHLLPSFRPFVPEQRSALRGGAEPREEAASARSQAADGGDGGAANPPIWIFQETKVPLEVSSTKAPHETT